MDDLGECWTDFLEDYNPDYSVERLRINLHSEQNMLQLAMKNKSVREALIQVTKHDFILGEHKEGVSYFGKRNTFKFYDKNILKYEGVFYKLQEPIEQRFLKQKRLLVIFSHFSGDFSAYASKRMAFDIWPDVQKYIVKDTYVLRIMDFNLTHGSWYLNTENFVDFEERIQSLIYFIIDKYCINMDEVCLYGSSKGGVGAFIHSLLGDFNSVVVDPILDDQRYLEENDIHFLKDLREIDLVPKCNILIEKNVIKNKKFIITNSHYNFNYETLGRLKSSSQIKIVNIDMINAYHHLNIVGPNSRVQLTTLINFCLDSTLKLAIK